MSSAWYFAVKARPRDVLMVIVAAGLLVAGGVTNTSRADTVESQFAEQAGAKGRVESHYSATVGDDGEISIITPEEVELRSGSALIEARNTVTVVTGAFKTTMKKGALALFRMEGTTARCFVLLGTAKVHAGADVHLGPTAGTEVVLCDHKPDDHELLYRDELGRRAVKISKVDDKVFLATSEFSVAHALDREPLVTSLAHSKNPKDRVLKYKLMKTAAVLNMVTAHRGSYTTGR